MDIFFEIYQDLPRQGPGDNQSTQRAISLLTSLPLQPLILDIGCGTGASTIELAKQTQGNVIAIDSHQPFLETLKQQALEEGVAEHISAINASMFALEFEAQTFDVIWAEGAIYIIGFEQGLRDWRSLLKLNGYLVVSELSWLRPQPPKEVQAFWETQYPGIRTIEENLTIIHVTNYRAIEHFVLPPSSWWTDYYSPLEARIAWLRDKYRDDREAQRQLDETQFEIELYRKYSDWYGYVFYVMQIV